MSKQKQTMEDIVCLNKGKQPNKFVWWFLRNLIIKPFLEPKYHVTYTIKDKLKDCPTGAFIVYNHSSRADYVWLMNAAWPRRINFVVGHNEFFRQKFKLIFKLCQCIPKKNFTSDIPSIRAINRVIKDNGVVCFSPEGMSSIVGHNQPIVPGTGDFFKHYNVPVYVLKIKGGYLTNHKVDLSDRLGKMEVEFSKLLTPEQIASTSGEEIDNIINKAIWHDDYEYAKQIHTQFKNDGQICYHLGDINYKCPKCGAELTMVDHKNVIECTKCGNGATMDDYYDFHPFNKDCVIPESPSKWVDWERGEIIKEIRKDPNYSMEFDVKVGVLPPYRYLKNNETSEIVGSGHFVVDHQGIHFKGEKNNEPFDFELTYNDVFSLVVVTDVTFFSFYIQGIYHEFFPSIPLVGKLLLVVEEMHRLHVNKWKNFPWMNYLYKGTELEEKEK